jgi:hypothetical protein
MIATALTRTGTMYAKIATKTGITITTGIMTGVS